MAFFMSDRTNARGVGSFLDLFIGSANKNPWPEGYQPCRFPVISRKTIQPRESLFLLLGGAGD